MKKLLLTALFLLTPFISQAALSDSLVSYWNLNESSGNAADSFGSNTLTNTGVTYTTGINSNGGVFSESSDKLAITDASQSGLDFDGDFTFSFWVNLTSNTSSSFFAKQGANGYRMRIYNGDDMELIIFQGAATTQVIKTGLSTGSWHHIVGQRTGDTVQIKFDNSAWTSQGGAHRDITNTGDFNMGNSTAVNDPVQGMMDEVGIWSRALTDDEITTLYNSGAGTFYPFPAATTPAPAQIIWFWEE